MIKEVELIIQILEENNFCAYVVGGAVRDYYLGVIPDDYDLCTNALPDDIIDIFKNKYKVVEVGKEFGTIGIIINSQMYEITTFRIEKNYFNHRKPKNIEFVDELYQDLSRRDFTINALAYNNRVYDYYNGINDIENKIIRTVGDPKLRFEEDGLRILRCFRFASKLGFKIEDETEKAALRYFDYIFYSSSQRRAIEIKKMIEGKYYIDVLKKYGKHFSNLLNIYKFNDFYNYLEKEVDFDLKILLMYYHHQDLIMDDLLSLEIKKSSIEFYKDIYKCIKYIDFSNEVNIRKKIVLILKKSKSINDVLKRSIEVQYLIGNIDKNLFDVYNYNLNIALNKPYLTSHVNIKGDELLKMGFSKSEIVGILNEILYKIIKEELENDRKIINDYVLNNF